MKSNTPDSRTHRSTKHVVKFRTHNTHFVIYVQCVPFPFNTNNRRVRAQAQVVRSSRLRRRCCRCFLGWKIVRNAHFHVSLSQVSTFGINTSIFGIKVPLETALNPASTLKYISEKHTQRRCVRDVQAERRTKSNLNMNNFFSIHLSADDDGGGGGEIEHVHEHSASLLPIHAHLHCHCLIGSSPMGMPSVITISIHENAKLKDKNTSADDRKNATDFFFLPLFAYYPICLLCCHPEHLMSLSMSAEHRALSTLCSVGRSNPVNGPNFHFVMNYLHILLGHGPSIRFDSPRDNQRATD